jgi:hypothetical protein
MVIKKGTRAQIIINRNGLSKAFGKDITNG